MLLILWKYRYSKSLFFENFDPLFFFWQKMVISNDIEIRETSKQCALALLVYNTYNDAVFVARDPFSQTPQLQFPRKFIPIEFY